ncbi:hypothetical protein ABH309_18965 [Chromobacterium piscinae]|uniref:Flagellar FliJ protein n=1 Tax=Chromobacterium piscinae TaxID=686831 RepID=A0ABV0HA37_9NEIS
MHLLHNARRLLRRSDVRIQHCETQLAQLARAQQQLAQRAAALTQQQQALQQLLLTLRASPGCVSRGGLFDLLRRHAVLRRQSIELAVQQRTLDEQQTLLSQDTQEVIKTRQHWRLKHDRYDYLIRMELRKHRLQALAHDETETQERTTWGK